MSFRDDFYSKDATLVQNAIREFSNGLEKAPIYKLRLMCFAEGVTGLLGLTRCFQNMDKNSSNSLCFEELAESLKQFGIDWNENEIKTLFNSFDVNQNGKINTTELIIKLRPSMTDSRLNIINKAFQNIDKNCDGIITVEDLKNVYCVREQPKYFVMRESLRQEAKLVSS